MWCLIASRYSSNHNHGTSPKSIKNVLQPFRKYFRNLQVVVDVKTVCAVSVKEEAVLVREVKTNSSYDVKDYCRLQWEFV